MPRFLFGLLLVLCSLCWGCATVTTIDRVASNHQLLTVELNRTVDASYGLLTIDGSHLGVASADAEGTLRFDLPEDVQTPEDGKTLYLIDEATREPIDPTGYDDSVEWGFESSDWNRYQSCKSSISAYRKSPSEPRAQECKTLCGKWTEFAGLTELIAVHWGQNQAVLQAHEEVRSLQSKKNNAESRRSRASQEGQIAAETAEISRLSAELVEANDRLESVEASLMTASKSMRTATALFPSVDGSKNELSPVTFTNISGDLRDTPPRERAGDVKSR